MKEAVRLVTVHLLDAMSPIARVALHFPGSKLSSSDDYSFSRSDCWLLPILVELWRKAQLSGLSDSH